MFLILLTLLTPSLTIHFKPPRNIGKMPQDILEQFLDYDLIIHFDNSSSKQLNFLVRKSPDHQTVHLINYDTSVAKMERPKGYKYVNIVLLKDPFKFQAFSTQPYNFFQYDFVLFATKRVQGAQIWKMSGLKRASAVFVYNFMVGRVFHCCYYCGNATAILKETKTCKMRSLLNNYSNFNGHVFRIAYTNFAPFFWKEGGDERPKGPEGNLLHEFSRVHNFRYELIYYKSKPKKGAWQAMIEAVEANAVDWAVGGLSMSLRRGTYTDFTRYIKTQGFSILYAVYPDTWTSFESILLAFEWLVWMAIAATIVVICFVAKIANGSKVRGAFCKYARLAVLAIVEQATSQHQMKLVKLPSVRTIFSVWWLMSLSLTSIYKSQLASFLIKPSYNQPDKIDDLVEKNFRFHVNKEDWSVLKENLETSLDKVYSTILTRVRDGLDFCDSILVLKNQQLAVIDEEIAIQYDIFKRCSCVTPEYRSNLRLVTENIFPSTYHAWSMPMGTPFRLKFSKTIGRMDDYGLIAQWYKSASFYHIPRSNSRTQGRTPLPLTLIQFLPPLMILGIGLSISFLVFLTELYVK